MARFYMGKRNKTEITMVKTFSIILSLIFTISTITMFFIFPKYVYSVINVFTIKNIFDISLYLVFDSSTSIFFLLYMVLSPLCLIISNIVMIFTKWGIIFPTIILSTDIIYQLHLIMKNSINVSNYLYLFGIVFETITIFFMIVYFIKAKNQK